MSKTRNVGGDAADKSRSAVDALLADERPYTARSVLASTLLGIDPPRLPARLLVRTGELFGIAEGTVRVAVSRMVGAGELVADDGHYHLSGALLDRQARQTRSRSGRTEPWQGHWRVEVVVADSGRSANERAELRTAMAALRLAEWREGVWLRPDNLRADAPGPPHVRAFAPNEPGPSSGTEPKPSAERPGAEPSDVHVDHAAAAAEQTVRAQCRELAATPADDPATLAAELWDLHGWATRARLLQAALGELVDALEAGDAAALSPGFVVSAAALRHFQADPLLPSELVPHGWPGPALRTDYDRYDRAFKAAWAANFRTG